MSQEQNLISLPSFKCLHQIQSVQWPCSVLSSLTLKTKPAQEDTVCAGSELDQMNLIPVSFTLMETVMMNVRAVLMSSPLRKSAPLMLEPIPVLWSHVGRYYLEALQNWTFRVTFLYKSTIIIHFECDQVILALLIIKIIIIIFTPLFQRSTCGICRRPIQLCVC